jgi:hypothetical protein
MSTKSPFFLQETVLWDVLSSYPYLCIYSPYHVPDNKLYALAPEGTSA